MLARALAACLLTGAAAQASAGDDDGLKNPYAGDPEIAHKGGSLFNQYCSHCHGQWADQGERPRDLRRLRLRYGDDAINVFYQTVMAGRLDKGMPVWAGVLEPETVWKIFTFLETKQAEE